MGATEVTMHQAECDNCQAILEDGNGFNCWMDAVTAEEKAMEANWQINNEGDLYCPSCVKEVTEEGVIILHEKKPLKKHPSLSIHPGKIFLEEVMKPHDISLSQASELLSIDEGFLNEIVNGTKDIDEKLAKKIADKFGGSKELWIRLQTTYNNDKSIKSEDMKEE